MPLSHKQFYTSGTKALRAKFKTDEDFRAHMKKVSDAGKEARAKARKKKNTNKPNK